MSYYRWEVEQRDGKWFCCGYSYERMRITADGQIQIGSTEPVESYEFSTEWAAKAQQRFCQRLEVDHRPITLSFAHGDGWDIGEGTMSGINTLEWKLAGRTVLALDRHHQVKTLDLPYIVWAWLRTTAVARGLRAFWYGWGQKPSHQ